MLNGMFAVFDKVVVERAALVCSCMMPCMSGKAWAEQFCQGTVACQELAHGRAQAPACWTTAMLKVLYEMLDILVARHAALHDAIDVQYLVRVL